MKVESRIKMVERSSPESLELARWVCLATRIEPALLRRARLGLMTKASASAESDLWLGPLVQTRGARFILLYPEVSDHLRKKLAENSGDLAKAWKLLRRTHRYMPELVRLEEKLTWLTLKGGSNLEERIDARLRPVIKAIVANQRAGLGRWALGILPRLPENARTRTARLLQMISESHLYGSWSSLLTASDEESSGDELSDEERALFLHNLEQTSVGIRLLEGRLEVSEPPADGSQMISVPTTNPRVLELTGPDEERQEKIAWRQGEQASAHNIIAPITISTLAGESYQVVSQSNVIKALREKVLPFTVTIHNPNYTPVAAGLLVDDHHVVTTTSSLEKSKMRVKSSSTFEEDRVLISFQGSTDEPFFAEVIARAQPYNTSSVSDGLVLIELEGTAAGAHPARLDLKTDEFVGKSGVILSYQPYQRSRLSRFEVTSEMIVGGYRLNPVTKLSKEALESLSGSPLVDPASGDVMGILHLRESSDAPVAYLATFDAMSRDFPDVFHKQAIYISYNREDERWVGRLETALLKTGRRDVLFRGDAFAALGWKGQSEKSIAGSEVNVLLVSQNYLETGYIQKRELPLILKSVQSGLANLFWIAVSESKYHETEISRYQALNDPSRPLDTLDAEELDKQLDEIARVIGEAMNRHDYKRTEPMPEVGTPAHINNIPYARNPFFTGREEILSRLHESFSAPSRGWNIQALTGLGGIGKTQIALEYAMRYADEYKYRFWARADAVESLSAGFSEIAKLLHLPEPDRRNTHNATLAVKEWLSENSDWLLILDNADEPSLVREFLPEFPKGHILLTSRAQIFDGVGSINPVEVEEMSLDDARNFLLRQTGRGDLESDEARAIEDLAAELDYMPLALEQAGSYIKELRSSFQDYLASYRKRGLDLLEKSGPAVEYGKSVRTTWSMNFRQVEESSKAAADLLRVSAFLNPDRIPDELIRLGAVELGPELSAALANVESDPLLLDKVMNPLIQYSLIHRDHKSKSYNINRMVQAVLKYGMDEATQKVWAERVTRALNRTFPEVIFATWGLCERLLPHAYVCAGLIGERQLYFPEAASLLFKMGIYLKERGRFVEARTLFLETMTIQEKALGPDHTDFARTLATLANLYIEMQRYDEAERLFKQALEIQERGLGPDHPDFARTLGGLAVVYLHLGDYAAAEDLLRRALSIQERILGTLHPDVARTLNSMAARAQALELYREAEPLYQRAVDIQEKTLGPQHPDVAKTLAGLAKLYLDQEKYFAAEPVYKRAVEIQEKALGPEHPALAITLKNYAELLRATGRESEAETLDARASRARASSQYTDREE